MIATDLAKLCAENHFILHSWQRKNGRKIPRAVFIIYKRIFISILCRSASWYIYIYIYYIYIYIIYIVSIMPYTVAWYKWIWHTTSTTISLKIESPNQRRVLFNLHAHHRFLYIYQKSSNILSTEGKETEQQLFWKILEHEKVQCWELNPRS